MSFDVITIYYIFLVLLVFDFWIWAFLEYLNKIRWTNELPVELSEIYDEEKYKKSMSYEREKYVFSKFSNIFSSALIFIFVLFWFFWKIFDYIISFWFWEFFSTLLFFLVLFLAQSFVNLPFSYYYTFVIEQKYWFNKMDKKLFFQDFIKSLILTIIIWWILLSIIILIYFFAWKYFWILAWALMVWFSTFMLMFYSSLIVPIFNKQTPLENWSLREKIEDFAKKVGFRLDNIFVIDWSKRSTKANAYFSGLWPKKRIVLFDTLISDLTDEELVWVLAHEIGHYKKKHTLQMLIFSIIQTGIIFYVLWIVLNYTEFSLALGSNSWSFALWVIAFSIIFSPLSLIFGVLWNIFSRKNEYEADEFAGKNHNPEDLKTSLIKLSKNNLSNLRPHPLYEFFYYSHPTLLKRLDALDKIKN